MMNLLDVKTCASMRGSESLKKKNALMNIKIVRKWMLIPNEMVLLALSRIGGTQGGGEHTKI